VAVTGVKSSHALSKVPVEDENGWLSRHNQINEGVGERRMGPYGNLCKDHCTKSHMKGLLINSPWIEMILEGKKTWEIRGANTKLRGPIALIKSGSGKVVGTCAINRRVS